MSQDLLAGFSQRPIEAYLGKTDHMLVFENEEQVRDLKVNLNVVALLESRGVIVTAKGNEVDFVSRFFAPQSGISEDPVTGSAHRTLTPLWAKKLNKIELDAIQLSSRKGYLKCKYLNDRVEITGQARTYLIGDITI